jgi:hypothetical protein
MKKIILFVLLALILASCSPTPPAALLATTRPIKYHLVDRASDSDLADLAAKGFNAAILRFSMSSSYDYRPSWPATMQAANAAGIQVIAWPADWDHPRPNCGHESPFPVSADGNIDRIKPLLDVLVQYGALGIVTVHEAQSNCPMTVAEMIGLKSKIVEYTTAKGHTLQVWNYVGVSKFASYPTIYTAANVPAMMDVWLSYKFCEGRTDYTCESLPGRIQNDRAKMDALGLTGKVDYVWMLATYATNYAPYNVRQTLARAEAVSKSITDTGAIDGFGYYTYRAGWWANGDLAGWPDMQPLIPYVYSLLYPGGETSTPAPATVTPLVTVTPIPPTRTPAPPTKTPTKTPLCTTIYTDTTKGFSLQICALP